MLRGLRRTFVVITMALVGSVLVGVLGFTLLSTWNAQRGVIDETLSRSLENDLNDLPMLGIRDRPDGRREANMLVLSVDVSIDGAVLETSRAPITINSEILDDVIETALDTISARPTGEVASGADAGAHVAWKAAQTTSDAIRVVIADTSAMDRALGAQIVADLAIMLGALAVTFGIVWWLSGWALRPVSRAWEEQRRFVADASHELKTPLAVIIANTQILERDLSLPADARHWVDSTAEEAGRMKALVNDLLELARADEGSSGTASLRREDVNLSDLVDGATLEFDAVAFEHGCQLDAKIEPDLHVSGDPEWLDRVVRILIDNAIKYADAGTAITVRLSRDTGRAGHATLRVNNLGTPIDAEDLPHVFDRFYRSDKARTRDDTSGFGLGLAIAKGTIEAHGGHITCTSDVTKGTTFTVTL